MSLLQTAVFIGSIVSGVVSTDVAKEENSERQRPIKCEDIAPVPHGTVPGKLQKQCQKSQNATNDD